MKPRKFTYCRPDTVEEALSVLAQHGDDAVVLAGGQSLMPMLNLRLVDAPVILDIGRLQELQFIHAAGDWLEIGAAVTQAKLLAHPQLDDQVPLLRRALPFVGHVQTRSRGTVCGSLAHADPSSEIPLCLATLGGQVVLRSARGERVLDAADFQTGLLSTARASDELIVAARFPLRRAGQGVAFTEVARRHGDFAIVSLAAVVQDGRVALGVGGVADRPTVHAWPVAQATLDDTLNDFAWSLGGRDDIHATAHYRRDLVRRLGRTVVQEALACAA
ncbi:MAG: FAD binding domain-containing protein [Alphaproteobacteria bacterium]|nr:FAD binding domain-containing protein [Alphaproteobacteria bacterium]